MNFNNRAGPCMAGIVLLTLSWGCNGQIQQQRTITQLSDNVYRAQDDRHFTVFMTTSEGIVLADPISKDFATWLKTELTERFELPVRYVLYSHHHWDHASGGAVFADTAQFVGHENMLGRLAMPPSDTPLPEDVALQDSDGNGTIELNEAQNNIKSNFWLFDADGDGTITGAEVTRGPLADVQVPDITYSERAAVRLGGFEVELTWAGHITHTDDMSVIRFPHDGVLYVVDFISIKSLPYRTLGSKHLGNWLESVRAVEAMEFNLVAPAHGSVGAKQDVANHREYLEKLRDSVSASIEQGDKLDEMQRDIDLKQYSHWAMYDEWRADNVAGMYKLLQNQREEIE